MFDLTDTSTPDEVAIDAKPKLPQNPTSSVFGQTAGFLPGPQTLPPVQTLYGSGHVGRLDASPTPTASSASIPELPEVTQPSVHLTTVSDVPPSSEPLPSYASQLADARFQLPAPPLHSSSPVPLVSDSFGWVGPTPGPEPGLAWGGIGIRIGALLLDSIFFYIFIVIIAEVMDSPGLKTVNGVIQDQGLAYVIGATSVLISLFYVPVCWFLFNGTAGQRMLSLRVVRSSDGGKLSVGRILLRYLVWAFCLCLLVPAIIAGITAVFNPKKRAWTDYAGDSVVVKVLPDNPRPSRTVLDFDVNVVVAPIVKRWAEKFGYTLDVDETNGSYHCVRDSEGQRGLGLQHIHLDLLIKDNKTHAEAWIKSNPLARTLSFGNPAEMSISSGGLRNWYTRRFARKQVNSLLANLGGPEIT
jgi:uncharacterized RDD family membrane protein YckC